MLDTFTTVNGRNHGEKLGNGCPRRTNLRVDRPALLPSVLSSPLDASDAAQLAAGFTALADPVRLQVLSILAAATGGEVCVCDFVEPLGKSQPTVAHHLKVLAGAGPVHGDRRGKWVYYSLDRGRLASLRAAIDS
jgi:ArsR family transcriptional regulator